MENKEIAMSKLNTYDKVVKVIWYIIFIVGISVILYGLALICLNLFGNAELPTKGSIIEFTTPGLKMKLESNLLGDFFYPAQISMLINIALIWALLLYSTGQLSKILKSLKVNNTPFIDSNIRRIRCISYSFFLYSIIIFILCIILKGIFTQNSLIAGLSGISIQVNTELPLWSILCGFLILGIAEIFNYGSKLQQDNDSIV